MTVNAYILPYFEALSVVLSKINVNWRTGSSATVADRDHMQKLPPGPSTRKNVVHEA